MSDILRKVGSVRIMVLLEALLLVLPNPAVAFFRNTMIGELANARMDHNSNSYNMEEVQNQRKEHAASVTRSRSKSLIYVP